MIRDLPFDFTLYARACHPVFQHDVRLHHADSLVWLVLPFGNEFKFESDHCVFDLCRLKDGHATAALRAPVASSPVLACAAAAAL